jgi:hypothetical protein
VVESAQSKSKFLADVKVLSRCSSIRTGNFRSDLPLAGRVMLSATALLSRLKRLGMLEFWSNSGSSGVLPCQEDASGYLT